MMSVPSSGEYQFRKRATRQSTDPSAIWALGAGSSVIVLLGGKATRFRPQFVLCWQFPGVPWWRPFVQIGDLDDRYSGALLISGSGAHAESVR